MIVHARAPLRIGLAGGGTDVSPYCDMYGGCVLNATIDRHAYAILTPLAEKKVIFKTHDRSGFLELPLAFPLEKDGKFDLHIAVYNAIIGAYNDGVPLPLELKTFCQVPAGSGLGSSSTLVVAMIKAFVEYLNLPLDDYDIARLAFHVERVDCRLQGGRQDQFSATFGGINFMEFYAQDKVIVNPLRIKNWILCEMEASLLLFFSGVSRASANVIASQSERVAQKEKDALEATHALKQEAISMKECLLRGDFEGIVTTMRRGWENKKRTSPLISTSHLESIYATAMENGALAGRISGAGGGGFMLFFVPVERRLDVARALSKFDGQASGCHFTKSGAQAWKIFSQSGSSPRP